MRCCRSASPDTRRARGRLGRRCGGGGGILAQIGAIVATIFGTNVKRGRLSTGQVVARNVARTVTNQVAGGVAASVGKSLGGAMGSSVGRALVRGALGGLLRR